MKRYLLILLIGILVTGYFLGIRKLESFVLQEARKVLPEFVTVEAININPLTHVTLKGVNVLDVSDKEGNIFSAESLKIRFNPLKGIRAQNLSAINALVLDKPIINIKHYRDDTFNVLKLIELLDLADDGSQDLFDIDFNVRINDGIVEYYDERGFGEYPLKAPEVNKLYKINTIVNYRDGFLKIKRFSSLLNEDRNRIFLSGEYDSREYFFKLKASDCEISKEINYFIPLKEIDIKKAEGDIEIIFRKNEVTKQTDLPIRFDVEYKSRDTKLKLDWIAKDLFIGEGLILVNNKGVQLYNLQAEVEKEEFSIQGAINDFFKLDIKLEGRATDMTKASKAFQFLQPLSLAGKGNTDVEIVTNKEGKVVISGKVENYIGKVLGYELDKGTASFVFVDGRVDLIFPEINAYKGVGRGYGYVEMKKGYPPYVSVEIDIRGIELFDYFKADPFQGQADLMLRINSYVENLNGVVDVTGRNANIFGQDLLKTRLYWQAEKDRTSFADNSFIIINDPDSVINMEGFLKKDQNFTVSFSESVLDVDDFYFFYSNTGNYKAKATFEGAVSGVFNDDFKKDPISVLKGELGGTVDYFEVLSPNMLMTGNLRINFKKRLMVSVNMKNKDASLAIKTTVADKKMQELKIKTSKINLDLAKSFVRPVNIDYRGHVSCDITLFPDQNMLFLKGQGVTGAVELYQANIASQNIDFFQGKVDLSKDSAKVKQARLINDKTDVSFFGEYQSTADFSLNITTGSFSSYGWRWFPASLRGELKEVKGRANSTKGKITFDLEMAIKNVFYQGVFLPDAEGRFVMDKQKMYFEDVEVSHFRDSYLVSGSVYLEALDSGINPFDLRVHVVHGELENIFELFNNIQINWRNKRDLVQKEARVNTDIFDAYNALLKREAKNLYSLRGDSVSDVLDSLMVLDQTSESSGLLPGIYGTLKGDLHISYWDELLLFSDLVLKDGRYQFMNAKEIKFLSVLKDDYFDVSVEADKARIMNKSFEELNFFAKYFPDREEIEISNFFVKIGNYRTNDLLKGKINLTSIFKQDGDTQEALDLYLFLNKDDIDVLTIFNKMLAKIKNQGTLLLHITGPFKNPKINSKESTFRNFEIIFAPSFMLRTPIRIASANLTIKDSEIIFPADMRVQWQGMDTGERLNEFIVNGKIGFPGFLNEFAGVLFDFDIIINPMTLQVDIRDLFQGRLQLSQTSLKGRYTIPIRKEVIEEQIQDVLTEREEGPVLKTRARVEKGVYQLALGIGGSVGLPAIKPPILLDLEMILGKDIQIVQKSNEEDINRWFTNINVVFEERTDVLKVEGSLNTIDTEGIFKFSSGRIIFMNKVFNLMDRQKQREIFGAGSAEIGDNYVEIKMEQHPVFSNKRKATPYFNVKTFSDVQKQTSVTGSAKVEDHLFVIFIQGPINDLNSFFIEHYKKEDNVYVLVGTRIHIADMTPDQMETVISYLVPAVFRPDFYRSILEEGLADNQEANTMLREYSASQINIWIDQQLRPFEQEIARNMGLYDVNIKHDLGGELVNAMQIFQNREDLLLNEAQEEALSVEYVKDIFFKRFFVKVKTGISQDPTKPLLNMSQYELVWFLNDYLSLNYGNYNLNNVDTTYGAFSINANFVF